MYISDFLYPLIHLFTAHRPLAMAGCSCWPPLLAAAVLYARARAAACASRMYACVPLAAAHAAMPCALHGAPYGACLRGAGMARVYNALSCLGLA